VESKEETFHVIKKENLEIIMWFINMFDARRASLESRAGITVSISSLLFGGFLFLFEKVLSDILQYKLAERIMLLISSSLSIVILAGAIISATLAIANVHKTSKRMYGADMPARLFFYPRATFERFPIFNLYLEAFMTLKEEELKTFMVGELWVLSHEYHNRYQNLRRALQLLSVSIVPILIAIVILFSKYF
jgi:hypothetical protein